MKQVNLTISFDEEKLSALKRYMSKRDLELEREMTDALVKLYEKYVPAPTSMRLTRPLPPDPGAGRGNEKLPLWEWVFLQRQLWLSIFYMAY